MQVFSRFFFSHGLGFAFQLPCWGASSTCFPEPWSGSSQGEIHNHTVMCFTSPLDPGSHQCNLTIHSSGGTGIFTVYVNVVSGGKNTPPTQPSNPLPSNGGIISDLSPVLSVLVNDPNQELMTVSFYDAADDSLIGSDLNVMSGTRAYTMWDGLIDGETYIRQGSQADLEEMEIIEVMPKYTFGANTLMIVFLNLLHYLKFQEKKQDVHLEYHKCQKQNSNLARESR